MSYQIVTAPTIEELVAAVIAEKSDGWVIVGPAMYREYAEDYHDGRNDYGTRTVGEWYQTMDAQAQQEGGK